LRRRLVGTQAAAAAPFDASHIHGAKTHASACRNPGGTNGSAFAIDLDLRREIFKRTSCKVMAISAKADKRRRTSSDSQHKRLRRMYATINATNEAILRARSSRELYQGICDAAVHAGKFLTVAAFLKDAATDRAVVVGCAGQGIVRLLDTHISLGADVAEGRGAIGTGFRTRSPCVINDYLRDPRTAPWRKFARASGVRSAVGVPLIRGGDAVGVIGFYLGEPGAFDGEVVALVQRLADNAAFALDQMDRESDRCRAEQSKERIGRLYAALSSTSEAILHAKSPQDLYQRVCDAAVHGGKFHITAVLLPDEDTKWMRVAAVTGPEERYMREAIRLSIDPAIPEGQGQTGIAFRSQEACVTNDLLGDERNRAWHEHARRIGVLAAASVPLVRNDRAVGVLNFYAGEKHAFDADIVALLKRMADNVSFALENFDRHTERLRVEQELRESEERFRNLTELSSDWYWEMDTQRRFVRFERHGNETNPRYLGKTAQELQMECEGGWEAYNAAFDGMRPFRDLIISSTYRGEIRYAAVSGTPRFNGHGQHVGYRGISRNITDRKRAEAQVQYLATHDVLTDLPNRTMFSQLLARAIESAKRYHRKLAVLFIDLDRFKLVNDTLGHEAGDALLEEMASRLKASLRASDVVARLGGDEFVVLVQEMNDVSQAAAVAQKILAAAFEPITILGHECRVTASVGIAMYPGDAEDAQSLMKNADTAMYLAKEEGKNNFRFYSKIKAQSLERLTLETNLRHALESNEFALHYQPKVDLKTGQITGVEALIRWYSPALGVVSPIQFIPLAEETGLIVPIGRWVLRTACAQNVAWQRQGLPSVCMAVNLTMRQFADENLLSDIRAALDETQLRPELLEVEVTEAMIVGNVERAIRLITAVKAMGVRLAIDDFGTGYSLLTQIKRFPIDTLKVDRSFVHGVMTETEDKAIAQAIIAMGKTLSTTVVAEGVETQEQETFLREHACDEMQGYYFSKPISAEGFAELLRKRLPSG
jgi:diguanylate cyclase (GGDEF)-like protein